jgi:hypothetical protein
MPTFTDLHTPLKRDPLVLPINGKPYSFPADISARTWLRVQQIGGLVVSIAAPETEVASDSEEQGFLREFCGDTLEEMLEDGVTKEQFKLVLKTLMVFHMTDDREAAALVWNARGEVTAPNRAAHQNQAPSNRGNSHASSTPPAPDTLGETSSTTGEA